MNWAAVILGCLSLLSALTNWARERNAFRAGEEAAIGRALQKQLDDIKRAEAARARVRSTIIDGRMPDDDGHRRD